MSIRSNNCISCGSDKVVGYWGLQFSEHWVAAKGNANIIGIWNGCQPYQRPVCDICAEIVGINKYGRLDCDDIRFWSDKAFKNYVDDKRKLNDQAHEIENLKIRIDKTDKILNDKTGQLSEKMEENKVLQRNEENLKIRIDKTDKILKDKMDQLSAKIAENETLHDSLQKEKENLINTKHQLNIERIEFQTQIQKHLEEIVKISNMADIQS